MWEKNIHTREGKLGARLGAGGGGLCLVQLATRDRRNDTLEPGVTISPQLPIQWHHVGSLKLATVSIYSMEIGRHYKRLFVPVLPINHSPAYCLMKAIFYLTWGLGINIFWTSWSSSNVMCLRFGYHTLDEGSLETIYSTLFPVIKEETQTIEHCP